MNCRITDLRAKEVINMCDGTRLGNVCDVEVDTETGQLVSIIIFGRGKLFGLGGKNCDIKICWKDINVIGDDTILVNYKTPIQPKTENNKRGGYFDSLFN